MNKADVTLDEILTGDEQYLDDMFKYEAFERYRHIPERYFDMEVHRYVASRWWVFCARN